MSDLFSASPRKSAKKPETYDASDIEVLEGLEPVRRRPGMYIGGTDERALHHLASEIFDNSMDEAVAGHADRIEIHLAMDDSVTVSDNGRGIPVDKHPKFPKQSALEVILTTLHSGGKFGGKAYETSGGLHGVGISVVNALSDAMSVQVAREGRIWRQTYSRGLATSKLEDKGPAKSVRGTLVTFHPDPEIFGKDAAFRPAWLCQMARAKAYLFRGVEIRWSCDPALLKNDAKTKAEEIFHFPNGLLDFLNTELEGIALLGGRVFSGMANLPDDQGRVEFAIAWPEEGESFIHSYCNTIPTPQGGSHESGLRTALSRSLKSHGEMTGNKRAAQITAEDVMAGAAALLSVFIKNPQFQGQTKEKLATPEAARLVDSVLKDLFDHWLSADPAASRLLLDAIADRAEERIRRRDDKGLARKSATRRLRLPGKLADCSRSEADGTELFIVEGDSAGGSAKQARNRETQAILPLRGKILNVVSATADKIRQNQEIQDLILALGCGDGKDFRLDSLRYERVIIMTDADVDGAHIASLLVTFFYTRMRGMIEAGRLYLAQPPLYRLSAGGTSAYARDDADRDRLLKTTFKGRSKVETSRFKGLGEMPAAQLRETTMNPASRTLIRVALPEATAIAAGDSAAKTATPCPELDDLVERLMGRNAEARFKFITENAAFVREIDV